MMLNYIGFVQNQTDVHCLVMKYSWLHFFSWRVSRLLQREFNINCWRSFFSTLKIDATLPSWKWHHPFHVFALNFFHQWFYFCLPKCLLLHCWKINILNENRFFRRTNKKGDTFLIMLQLMVRQLFFFSCNESSIIFQLVFHLFLFLFLLFSSIECHNAYASTTIFLGISS